jgi:hypothetical protein
MSVFEPGFETEVFTPELSLLASDHPTIESVVTVASGAGALAAGAVLGRITANGKYVLSLAAATDGSEVPRAVLATAVDATNADADAIAYSAGHLLASKLTFGDGHTADSARDGLRGLGLHI